jgi:hypothetical protein
MNVYKLIAVCLCIMVMPWAGYAQGKVSLGIDAGLRFEKAHFYDPKGYIFRRLNPNGNIGLAVNYAHNHIWEFEAGAYISRFHRTSYAFYNEPGYTILSRFHPHEITSGFYQIPLRAIYKSNIGYKKFGINFLGGINLLHLVNHPHRSWGMGTQLITIPLNDPGISLFRVTETLARSSLSFEAGVEIRREFGKRFYCAYRFTGLLGVRDLIRIDGHYIVGDMPEIEHEYEVLQRGSGLLHMLALRYRLKRD